MLSRTQYTGGTEIAWDGDYLYTGELNGHTSRDQVATKGGIHIFDVSQPAPVEVEFLDSSRWRTTTSTCTPVGLASAAG